VKSKKKFIVEKDYSPYIGKKSAWHSIRILDFGYQIAKYGKINDYQSVNNLLKSIMKLNSWEEIDENFKTVYNETASRFKEVAPKEINLSKVKMK
jgi:hypothetical protein